MSPSATRQSLSLVKYNSVVVSHCCRKYSPSAMPAPLRNLTTAVAAAAAGTREKVPAPSHSLRSLSTSAGMANGGGPILTADRVNPAIQRMEYAVRGPLVARATEIENELIQGVQKPFDRVLKANIGDAHAMGNPPIRFLRQVLAMVSDPSLIDDPQLKTTYPEDARERARTILSGCRGGSVGAYSDSAGIAIIRKHVAAYIQRRDGGVKSDPDDIVLCAGASEGIRAVMKLMISSETGKKKPGVMIPIPQYPLYSATLAEFNMQQIDYYLNEEDNWSLDISELSRSIGEARSVCQPTALVIINPGNPTGSLLTEENLQEIIRFAYENRLFLFADEVYQDNVYADGAKFHSVKKVLVSMGEPYCNMELASFMSCSKGYMGECGIRGGYAELLNIDPGARQQLNKAISAKLCPTVIGQACMDVVVNPPTHGEPSYETFTAQKRAALSSLADRAKLVEQKLNAIPGLRTNEVRGAMYAFPQISLPKKAIAAAEAAGQSPDGFYAFALLEATGICVVPGSGFGQRPGTYHFRTTILPQKAELTDMLDKIGAFHASFLTKYA